MRPAHLYLVRLIALGVVVQFFLAGSARRYRHAAEVSDHVVQPDQGRRHLAAAGAIVAPVLQTKGPA
jgi:hypothetical protein